MKKYILLTLASTLLFSLFTSCSSSLPSSTPSSGWYGSDPTLDPYTKINSINDADLIISDKSIEYTIDYSTSEGRLKLQGKTIEQACRLALVEATIKYKCAKIVSPQYTHFEDGKQVLRVTVYGFPGKYKNAQRQVPTPSSDNGGQRIEININR